MSYIGNQPYQAAFVSDTFSGNASTTAFTMSVAPANTSSVLVAITGVLQDPSTYSVVGTTLTFSAAPPTGTGNISVRYLGIPASGVTTTAYRTVTEFTATAGQTTFTPPSYTVGFINVYRNGVLQGSGDYTASNGTTIVLGSGALAGDLVTVESFLVSSVLNAIPATAGSVGTTYLTDGGVTTSKILDANVTQSKLAANVVGNGPAFRVYQTSGTSIPNTSFTKVLFDTTTFDTTSGMWASSRFTPTVAGYYQITGIVRFSFTAGNFLSPYIYKTGALYQGVEGVLTQGTGDVSGMVTALVYCNGSTDYIELWVYQSSGATKTTIAGAVNTSLSAAMMRSA